MRWRQPALHPAGRDRDDLARERVGGRIGEQAGEGLDQGVGSFGAVEMEHALSPPPAGRARRRRHGAWSRAAVQAAVAAIPEGATEHRYRGCRHRDGDPDKCHRANVS